MLTNTCHNKKNQDLILIPRRNLKTIIRMVHLKQLRQGMRLTIKLIQIKLLTEMNSMTTIETVHLKRPRQDTKLTIKLNLKLGKLMSLEIITETVHQRKLRQPMKLIIKLLSLLNLNLLMNLKTIIAMVHLKRPKLSMKLIINKSKENQDPIPILRRNSKIIINMVHLKQLRQDMKLTTKLIQKLLKSQLLLKKAAKRSKDMMSSVTELVHLPRQKSINLRLTIKVTSQMLTNTCINLKLEKMVTGQLITECHIPTEM